MLTAAAQHLGLHVRPPHFPIGVKGDVVVFPTVEAVDGEDVDVGWAGAVDVRGEVRAEEVELEMNFGGRKRRGGGGDGRDGNVEVGGLEGRSIDAFFAQDVERLHRFSGGAGRAEVIRRPVHLRPVTAEKHAPVGGKVPPAEEIVAHGEHVRIEFRHVRFPFALHVPGTPAAVDELPFAVIDSHGVPGMGGEFAGDGIARVRVGEAEAFAVPGDGHGFKSGFER